MVIILERSPSNFYEMDEIIFWGNIYEDIKGQNPQLCVTAEMNTLLRNTDATKYGIVSFSNSALPIISFQASTFSLGWAGIPSNVIAGERAYANFNNCIYILSA